MTHCPSCQQTISNDASTCTACGFSFDDATRRLETLRNPEPKTGSPQTKTPVSFDSIDNSRFVAGTIIADRYRIIGLLGRGGMGEVYRAEDLKLGQPVALKFLPDHLMADGAALARFHREARVARQVSHKNVCRVYDIGEVDGRHFLSMEFIKGEELSSLLRRIGRLPSDKAIQLARQICAGLAAAHDVDVLHRDLKPANVMIDSDGNARILDFGLAGLTEEFGDDEIRAGTPAYMSPEQFEGNEQTVKSDIYSLGLLLYELFTGKRAFDAPSLNELIRLRRGDSTPTTPTSIVKDLDPVVEKVIDRCIQKDPALRPASALQVAAALPGGDPIAAALAAGETPSPEMCASAKAEGALQPAIAAGLLVSLVVLIGVGCWLTRYTALYRLTPLEKSPDVLQERARDVIKRAGYDASSGDSAYGMLVNTDYLLYVLDHDRSSSRWERMKTDAAAGYRYWYRQSSRPLTPPDGMFVFFDQPAQDVSGMAGAYLDMSGRLHYFIGTPPQRDEGPRKEQPAYDWSAFFTEAELDQSRFHPVTSTWVPLHAGDSRAAWEGTDPAHPEYTIHVEAASLGGRPVYFETIYPWDHPARQEEMRKDAAWRTVVAISLGVFILALIGSILLAIKNLRLGRGDRRGALRLAAAVFFLRLLWLIDAHHVSSLAFEFNVFISAFQDGLFAAAFTWLLYIALEPFVRRYWPGRIISWSRLLAGDWRDPLVGRDILIGAFVGSFAIRIYQLGTLLQMKLGSSTGGIPTTPFDGLFLGLHFFVYKVSHFLISCLFVSLFLMFLLLLLFLLLRRERLAVTALCLVCTGLLFLMLGAQLSTIPFALAISALMTGVLYRFGLLASVASVIFYFFPVFFPHVTDISAWYATDFTLMAVILIGLAAIGGYLSLAGQQVFKGGLLRE